MITTQLEAFSKIKHEMVELFEKHHKEIGNYIEKMPLDPKYDEYLAMERNGTLQIVTARDDGKLVGYYVGFISGGLHYRSTLTNKEDIFFIDKGWRGGGSALGKLLFDHVKQDNIRRGVKFWRVGAKTNTPADFFLRSYGFEEIERHSCMWLGD